MSLLFDVMFQTEIDRLEFAKKLNRIGKFSFLIIAIAFNIGFWSAALLEYSKGAEFYL